MTCMQTMTSYNRHFRAADSLTANKKKKNIHKKKKDHVAMLSVWITIPRVQCRMRQTMANVPSKVEGGHQDRQLGKVS